MGEMVESCAPSDRRACLVCSPCTCQMLGRIVLPSILALPFHIALVFLRVSETLLQGVYSHTAKQKMRQKIVRREGRTSSVFAPRPLAGAPFFWEIRRIAWCAQVSLQSVRHRSGCEDRKTVFLARARQVRSLEGGGQGVLRWQIECTQRQFLGSARTGSSVVVVSTPTGPMEFHKSTQDGGRDPGVRRSGAVLSQSPASS